MGNLRLMNKRIALPWMLGIFSIIIMLVPVDSFSRDAVQLLKEAEKIANQPSDFKVDLKLVGNRDIVRIGQVVRFVFKTNKDCYLTLIHVDKSGSPVILFPNKWTKSNFVKAGKRYMVPPEESNFHIVASAPVGFEYVKAIASLDPIKALEGADLTQAGGFKVMKDPNFVMRGLAVEMGKREPVVWSTADVVFKIEKATPKE